MTIRDLAKKLAAPIQRFVPGFYDFAIKRLSSERVRTLRRLHKVRGENRLMAQNAPIFAADLNGRQGFGSTLTWAAGVLAYCEEHDLRPSMLFTNNVYAPHPGDDWLQSYFELVRPMEQLPRERYVPQSVHMSKRLWPTFQKLSIERCHRLFFGSFDFRPEFYAMVDSFCAEHGIGEQTIGVHFRGTDKRLEAARTPWETIAAQVSSRLGANYTNIFVATDEPEFLDFMRKQFAGTVVIDLDCQEIFSGKTAHLSTGDPTVKASEAIQTIITLSRCGILIRTRSHLSAWAKILKPSLPTVVFGEMLAGDQIGFPENAIYTDAV
jgi:hypothetical protein